MKNVRTILKRKMDAIRADMDALEKSSKVQLASMEKHLKALELAEKLIVGGGGAPASAAPKAAGPAAEKPARAKRRRRRKVDRDGVAKTAQLLAERAKATTVGQVARHFHITRDAANMRLNRLVKDGKALRVGRGIYAANSAPVAK